MKQQKVIFFSHVQGCSSVETGYCLEDSGDDDKVSDTINLPCAAEAAEAASENEA